MENYTMVCSNGWVEQFQAKSLLAAKIKATKLATHDAGSFSIENPEGKIFSRSIWHSFNAWGWNPWVEIENY